jgi:AcrR family transcriptional regulator
MGTESSKTRRLILDIVERLMLEEGYAAVGIRRVAREAGVTPPLIHYYFRTLDDLFLAVLRRNREREQAAQTAALSSDQPLQALWEHGSHPAAAALTMEFMALANHRDAVRDEVAAHAEQFRRDQLTTLTCLLEERGIDAGDLPPAALTVVVSILSRTLVFEQALGITTGHAETLALVKRHIRALQDAPRAE